MGYDIVTDVLIVYTADSSVSFTYSGSSHGVFLTQACDSIISIKHAKRIYFSSQSQIGLSDQTEIITTLMLKKYTVLMFIYLCYFSDK